MRGNSVRCTARRSRSNRAHVLCQSQAPDELSEVLPTGLAPDQQPHRIDDQTYQHSNERQREILPQRDRRNAPATPRRLSVRHPPAVRVLGPLVCPTKRSQHLPKTDCMTHNPENAPVGKGNNGRAGGCPTITEVQMAPGEFNPISHRKKPWIHAIALPNLNPDQLISSVVEFYGGSME